MLWFEVLLRLAPNLDLRRVGLLVMSETNVTAASRLRRDAAVFRRLFMGALWLSCGLV